MNYGPFDAAGRFGPYGGAYVPETLVSPLEELASAYAEARQDPAFLDTLDGLLRTWGGRPTPTTFAPRLTAELGGPQGSVVLHLRARTAGEEQLQSTSMMRKTGSKVRVLMSQRNLVIPMAHPH